MTTPNANDTVFTFDLPDGTYLKATIHVKGSKSRKDGEWVTCGVARHLTLTDEELNANFSASAGLTMARTLRFIDEVVESKREQVRTLLDSK